MHRFTPAAFAAALLAAVGPTTACEFYADGFQVLHPWTPAAASVEAAIPVFLTLAEIEADDRLLDGTTPVARAVEIRRGFGAAAADGVRVRADGAPSVHVQLVLRGLSMPLVAGRQYPLALRFEKAGVVDVSFVVGAH